MKKTVFSILTPRLNPNDDTVNFVEWKIENWSYVKKGQAVCEMETMKALYEITAEQEGIIYQIASPGSIMKIDECIGVIGQDKEAIKRYLLQKQKDKQKLEQVENLTVRATEKARKLIYKHGISLRELDAIKVKGTIKEADVTCYLTSQHKKQDYKTKVEYNDMQLSSNMLELIVKEGNIPQYKKFMGQRLKNSLQDKITTTIDTEIKLTSLNKLIQSYKQKKISTSLLCMVIYALSRCLLKSPVFTKFQHNGQVFRYCNIDIAFVVKAFDGPLYTPVIRNVDKLSVEEIAQKCQSVTLRANRHLLKAEEMEGACFTVTYIPQNIISRFTALINQFQSAIIAISGEQNVLCLQDDKVIQIPKATLTLSYDHMLIDGWDSAIFLGHLRKELNQLSLDVKI